MQEFFVLLLISSISSTSRYYIFRPGPFIPASKGEIWPRPQHQDKLDNGYFTISPETWVFYNIGASCNTLSEALERYEIIIRNYSPLYNSPCYEENNPNYLGFMLTLRVELKGPCDDNAFPSLEMKEEYILNITSTVQKLSSDTLWGVLRGLETFSQLIYLTSDLKCYRIGTTSIHDYPRFPHRGFLLDTSRHYQTKTSILKLLDAMSYNKLNVFHWHITDDQSFPYYSCTFPKLSENGAYHRTLRIYDQAFVREVLDYARKRGIRVVPEFDTPGHTLSWGLGQPGLLTRCYNVQGLEWGPFDPVKESTYDFIFKFFKEDVKSVFEDNYTHLGGDEVNFTCWESNPYINQFMVDNDIMGDYSALQNYYMQRLTNYVYHYLGLNPIVWEEVFTYGAIIPKATIINVWKHYEGDNPEGLMFNVTAAGHRAIVSAYWYLDNVTSFGDWLKFYNPDPQSFNGNEYQKSLIMGGEVSMWAEYVDDTNLEPRVWPRASAAAERFWSPPSAFVNSSDIDVIGSDIRRVSSRLEEHRCRMKRRGIRAQPAAGPGDCF